MKMKLALKPTALRNLLIVVIILIAGLGVAGFYLADQMLAKTATNVAHLIADSAASGHDTESLKKIQAELVKDQAIAAKATSISTPLSTYQTQAYTDLNTYATLTGVQITNYSFAGASVAAATSTGKTVTATTPAATAGTSNVTITIASPVSYTSLLKFIKAIEGNLPKMQIASISLTAAGGSSGSDQVATGSLTIAVYTR